VWGIAWVQDSIGEEGTDLFVYDIGQKALNVGALRDIVDK
jgi:hypothetical protein